MARILIVEDDSTFSALLTGFLKKHGNEVQPAISVKEANEQLDQTGYDLVLLDYRLPDGTGLDVLAHIQTKNLNTAAIVMTSFHDIRTAVKTVKLGAYDYITKPVNADELLMVIHEALAVNQEEPQAVHKDDGSFVAGVSNVSQEIQNHVKLVAPTNLSLIIQGESGTGKEQVARTIHKFSKRPDGPFVALDCGALSQELASSELFGHLKGAFTGALQNKKGQFEMANGGTLFLDEVGNLSYEVQVKLLRALQERVIQPIGSNQLIKVDVRIIAATNDDLLTSVRNGNFREDLYHRFNEFKIVLPALRERIDDMELFISHFIMQANSELNKRVKDIDDEVRRLFYKYDWPGNLREMKNTIKRAVLLAEGSVITMQDLPTEMNSVVEEQQTIASTPDLKAMQALNEKETIVKVLREVRFNKSKAAKLLNIDRTTLYYKMAKYNIEG
jgi:two-component system response regulator HydG